MKRLILHVGVPKTGTSLIQRAMRRLREPLRSNGVTYFGRQAMNRLEYIKDWAAYPRSRPEYRAHFRRELRSAVAKKRRRILGRGPVIMSNESMIGSPAPGFGDPFWPRATAALSDIIEALEPRSTTVLLYTRRQDRFIESIYMQRIHLGSSRPWEPFFNHVCVDDRVRYQDVIDSILAVPTIDEVKVSPFEIIGAGAMPYVRYFLESLDAGIEHLLPHVGNLRQSNPSYTKPAYEMALQVNKTLETVEEKREMRRHLKKLYPVGEHPKPELLTDEQRASLIELYRPANEKLFATHMPEFPLDGYSTAGGTTRLAGWLE